MKLHNKVFLVFVIYLIVLLSCLVFMTYVHEDVHKIIYEDYGIESNISISFNIFKAKAVTIAEEDCPTEQCRLAHNINEIFEYQLVPFMFFIWSLFLILNLTIVISNHNKQETLNNLLDVLVSK